jgi:hypothetical protein
LTWGRFKTGTALRQADELVDLIDQLNAEDKRALKACLPDLVRDLPATPVAAIKTGKLMRNVEANFREAFKQILYGLITAKAQGLLKPFGF